MLSRLAPPPDLTVAYGDHPEQIADIRFPADSPAQPARPLVIVLHGGFWRAEYDRTHTGPMAADLAARGYLVAQLEYRRTGQPDGGWPGTFADVAAGVAALPALLRQAVRRTRAPDPPVLLVGHSAGGHLALWYAFAGPSRAGVCGILALAPVSDLAEAYRLDLDGGAVAALLGGGPDAVPDRYAAADPGMNVPVPLPCVVIHGALDEQVPVSMSRWYVSRARSAGGEIRLVELANGEHFGLIDPQAPAWATVLDELQTLYS